MNKQTLKEQNEQLLKEVVTLREQVKHLNENTIVQSMNDMKEQYEELKRESVPSEMYEEIKFEKKRLLKLMNTIEMINNLNLRKLFDISHFIKRFNEINNTENKLSERFLSICDRDLENITKNSRLIDEFITNNDEGNECTCGEY
jgi:phosphoribosyl-dephospho-CoA transferase